MNEKDCLPIRAEILKEDFAAHEIQHVLPLRRLKCVRNEVCNVYP
jgi:hypothetical protein